MVAKPLQLNVQKIVKQRNLKIYIAGDVFHINSFKFVK